MEMTDDGDSDAKVLSVPAKDPRYNSIQDLTDIDPHTLEEIKHFFKVYKDLQKKEVVVADWRDKSEATKDIQHSFDLYQKKYPKN